AVAEFVPASRQGEASESAFVQVGARFLQAQEFSRRPYDALLIADNIKRYLMSVKVRVVSHGFDRVIAASFDKGTIYDLSRLWLANRKREIERSPWRIRVDHVSIITPAIVN